MTDYLEAARNRIDDDTETINRMCAELGRLRAVLNKIRRIPTMPFPDRVAHSERAFANAVWSAWCQIQDAARAALEE